MSTRDTICHFTPMKLCEKSAQQQFIAETKLISALLKGLDFQLEQFGGTSVPGSLTKGDVDIQIRVNHGDFLEVIKRMKKYAVAKQVATWTENLASFANDKKSPPIDYVVTVNGSEEEKYYFAARDLLASDATLLKSYNDLKRSYEGRLYADYRAAKSAFWKKVFRERLGIVEVFWK